MSSDRPYRRATIESASLKVRLNNEAVATIFPPRLTFSSTPFHFKQALRLVGSGQLRLPASHVSKDESLKFILGHGPVASRKLGQVDACQEARAPFIRRFVGLFDNFAGALWHGTFRFVCAQMVVDESRGAFVVADWLQPVAHLAQVVGLLVVKPVGNLAQTVLVGVLQ